MPYEKIGKNEPVCIADEVPFEIPDSWEWVRLKELVTVLGGKRIPAGRKLTTDNTGHIYIRVSDMKKGWVLHSMMTSPTRDEKTQLTTMVFERDILNKCPSCGNQLLDGATFCGKCGFRMG